MKTLSLISILFFSIGAFAQKQANIWYFGNQAGLDFNSGAPVVLTNSAMNAFEGVSSICDNNGALLFYTDGISVWNANHVTMPNGTGLMGNSSSTQAALIVPQPGSANLYYLFTSDAFNGANGLRYNIIDMTLNGGLGDITSKNQLLYATTTERLGACSNSNGNDVWILSHQTTGQNFVAYSLTTTGLNLTPVYSAVGPVLNATNLDFLGYLKFSPKGDRVAMAQSAPDSFYVFDFNPSTGIMSNCIGLGSAASGEGAYGVEFSPNGLVLYGTAEIPFLLYTWDLTAGNAAAINASRITIPTQALGGSYIGSLSLAPDHKIYMTRNTCGWLGVINDPNVFGMGCNYVDSGIYLLGKTCVYGLPNLNQSYYTDFHVDDVCLGDSTHFFLDNTSGLFGTLWDFGDPGSGINNSSSIFNPSHLYTAPGVYTVQLIKYYLLYNDTVTIDVNVFSFPSTNLGVDTSFCTGSTYQLNAGGGYTSYLWQDASVDSIFTASVAGTYYVTVTNNICSSIDTIVLTEINCQPILAASSSDTSFCEKTCVDFFDLSNTSPTSWLWQFPGASPDTSTLQNPTSICYNNYGSFDVILIACGGLGCDTLTLTNFINEYQNPSDSVYMANDTLWSLPFPSYQWYNTLSGAIAGATNQYFIASIPGSYYCVVNDSIGCVATSNTIVATAISSAIINSQFSIYPNPFSDYLNIIMEFNKNENPVFEIYDLQGRIIQTEIITNKYSVVDVRSISKGVYGYRISSENKIIGQGKFLKM